MDEDCCELDGYLPVGVAGYGSTATVHLAECERDQKLVCVKKVRDGNVNVAREIENLGKCKHPNVCQLLEVVRKDGWVYIVQEYACGGCLSKWLMNGPANISFVQRIFIQLINALEYLHTECRIIHRDVKLENIMLDDETNVKLIDFGLSKEIEEDSFKGTACGSPAYVAPEIIKREDYGFPADVWAAGVVLYVMVIGRLPFSDLSVPGLLHKIVTEDLAFPDNLELDTDLRELLVRMFDKNPTSRITIPEIKRSPWLRKNANLGVMAITRSMNSVHDRKYHSHTNGPNALAHVPLLGIVRRRKMTNPHITPLFHSLSPSVPPQVNIPNTFKSQIRSMMIPRNILSDKRKTLVPSPMPICV